MNFLKNEINSNNLISFSKKFQNLKVNFSEEFKKQNLNKEKIKEIKNLNNEEKILNNYEVKFEEEIENLIKIIKKELNLT